MLNRLTFDELVESVTDLSTKEVELETSFQSNVDQTVAELRSLSDISRQSLANLIATRPSSIPLLVSCIGFTQERLKNQLKHRFGTSGWVSLARERSEELIRELDEAYDFVDRVRADLERDWTFSDVLAERYKWSRRNAGSAISRGRRLEDEVERVVKELGLPYEMREQFAGRGGVLVPCDLAVPDAKDAIIVGAAKGFNSTGSKLTDAVREIEQLATYRLPRQFVFAFVDGIGWKNRLSDLRRIFELWQRQEIDGIYTLAHMDRFRKALIQAAVRHRLIQSPTDQEWNAVN